MAEQTLAGKSILIADDEPLIRELLRDSFVARGCKVFEAESGTAALKLFHEHRPDVIVSDVRMPSGDGVGLLKAVRAESANTPLFCLISGFSDTTPDALYALGADAVFPKPFRIRGTLQEVERLLLPAERRWALPGTEPGPLKLQLSIEGQAGPRLGRGGICLECPQAFAVGDPLALALAFSEGEPLEIRGTGIVRWTRPGRSSMLTACGVEFLTLRPEVLPVLLKKIKEMAPTAWIPET